jgi:hypothetical protein
MIFEFTVHPGFNFVKSFGEKFNIPVNKGKLKIPAALGNPVDPTTLYTSGERGYIDYPTMQVSLAV